MGCLASQSRRYRRFATTLEDVAARIRNGIAISVLSKPRRHFATTNNVGTRVREPGMPAADRPLGE
jgi:hypothetical protein